MGLSKWGRWLPLVLVMSCNAKLQLGAQGGGGAGAGGAGGPGAGNGGELITPGAGGMGVGGEIAGHAGEAAAGAGASGFGGYAGYGGALVEPPPSGRLGQPCIPGTQATEAAGSVAQAVIKTLTHCDEGLVCNASGICVVAPDCPQTTGMCVVHQASISAQGSPSVGGAGGAGGASNYPAVMAEVGVLGMTSDAAHLYWTEYGTRNSLGTYQNDGTLMALSFADSKITTLASKLPGPNGLGITSAHAYVYVDGAPYIGSSPIGQMLRVPLAGGIVQVVSTLGSTGAFAAIGDSAFWVDNGDWKTASGASDPSLFSAMSYAQTAETDATSLYYVDANNFGLQRLPLVGGTNQVLATPAYAFALSGDFAYGVEQVGSSGLLLDKVSKSGGTWQRLQALGAGYSSGKLQLVGNRYYLQEGNATAAILTGSLTSSDPPVRALEGVAPSNERSLLWLATETSLYLTNGRTIYSRPVSDFH